MDGVVAASSSRHAESLSFLLSQIGARSAQLFAERLAPLGMSPRAFGVLSGVGRSPGQTQQQLADALGIHRNNMVGLIDELEGAGWVRRERSQSDRRAFNLQLTRTGAALLGRVDKVIAVVDDELGGGLPAHDRAALLTILRDLASSLGLAPGVHPYLRTGR